MFRFALGTIFATRLLTADSPAFTATVASTTVPAGGTAQIQIFLSTPHAIVSGEIVMDLDPAVFGDILSVDMFSATGDQLGSATVQGKHLDVHFTSQTGGIGRLPGLPVLVVSVPVLAAATQGKTAALTFEPGTAPWKDVQGSQYTVNITPGMLTVGGSVSVKDILPGGGLLPAGALVKIEGTGFTADTLVAIDGVSLASTTFVSPQEIDVTLGAPADLTGKAVRLGNRLGTILTFYSSLRANLIHRPDTGPLATILPILPSQLYTAADAGRFLFSEAGIALENPTPNPVDVTIQSQALTLGGIVVLSQVVVALPPRTLYIESGKNVGGAASDRATLILLPSAPIRAAVVDSNTARLVTPVPVPATQVSVILDGTSTLLDSATPLTWNWAVGSATPLPKTLAVLLSLPSTPFNVSASTESGGQWLSVSPSQGAACMLRLPPSSANCDASSKVVVSVDPSHLTVGVYKGALTFTTQGFNPQPTVVPVVFTAETQQLISVDRTNFDFGAWTVNTSTSAKVNVTSNADPLAFSATTTESWLSVTVNRATTPATLTISANFTGLSPGHYTGTITVKGPANTQTISLSTEVINQPPLPVLTTDPGAIQIAARTGEIPATQTIVIAPTIFDPFTVSATTADGGHWLTATIPVTPGVPTISVSFAPTSLAAGVYHGSVTILSAKAAGPAQVPVTLTIYDGDPPKVIISPSSLNFTAVSGTSSSTQTISFATGNLPLQYSLSVSDTWLFALPVSQRPPPPIGLLITPGAVNVTPTADALAAGTYHGTVTITAPPGSSNSTSISVTFTVTPAPPPLPQAGAVPLVTSLLNGAAQTSGSVSPGEIVTFFGQNIGPNTPAGFAFGPDGKVATKLSGTEILFDGTPAPLLYTSATQANAIVPYEVSGTTTIQLRVNGSTLSTMGTPVVPVAPAIFTLDSTGVGAGAVLNQDNSINSPSNPASRGSTIQIYATGAGILTPPAFTGEITGTSAKRPVLAVTVAIGGVDAAVSYAASAPNAVSGLLQVNAIVPQSVLPGPALTLVLTVGTGRSQDTVTVAVK